MSGIRLRMPLRFLASLFICAWVNSRSVTLDLRPLYLYLLSALFSFCWAVGTELWKQRAAACTNSLGSLARLFNPFHHRLTLMSPARLLQTCHHSWCMQDWHTHTHQYTPLNTTLPLRACLMMLFWCTPTHPWPLALCPLLSSLPLSLPSSPLPSQIPEGASLAMSLKDKKENTMGRGIRHLQTHPLPVILSHSLTHTLG